jgi:hypothetical protein
MALQSALNDRERDKFVELPNGDTAVQVTSFQALSPPSETDAITFSYPDAVTEVYQYRSGGIAGTILKTVTVVYTTAAKDVLQSVVVS